MSAICVLGIGIGFFMLEVLSRREKPPLGMVFNIIVGCLLAAVSGIVLCTTLYRHFFIKKRRSKSRPVFLHDVLTKDNDARK